MTKKTYKKLQFLLIFLLGAVLGFFNSMDLESGYMFIPIGIFILVVGLLWYMKRKVYDVLADERDKYIGGKAARYTLSIYILISSLISIIIGLMDNYQTIGGAVGLSIIIILSIYSLLFYYFNRQNENQNKTT